MTKHQAEIFVNAMIETGCNIQDVGREFYVLAERVDPDDEEALERIEKVAAAFPNREALKGAIIDYVHEIARVIP